MNPVLQGLRDFLVDDEGAQVIEYALIVAVVSLGLIAALMTGGIDFQAFVNRVNTCLTTGTCTGVDGGGGAGD